MAEKKQRPRFYVSCTQEIFDLVNQIAKYTGTKPSVVSAMALASGAKILGSSLLPDDDIPWAARQTEQDILTMAAAEDQGLFEKTGQWPSAGGASAAKEVQPAKSSLASAAASSGAGNQPGKPSAGRRHRKR